MKERKIKIAHEAPKSIFEKVQSLTDYDYFLANVLETDKKYLELAKKSVAAGREVILDNGVFETGEALDMSKFAEWVRELKPTYYIVPDVLEDMDGTIDNMQVWKSVFQPTIPVECKKMGVVQGKNYDELCECYVYMSYFAHCDKIAFSFDLSCYRDMFPHSNELVSWCFGRIQVLNKMLTEQYFQHEIPIHLLGCSLPVEFEFYTGKLAELIDSVDTSNPVVLGMNEIRYVPEIGPREKIKTKLYTMMNAKLDSEQENCIYFNIDTFRDFCSRNFF